MFNAQYVFAGVNAQCIVNVNLCPLMCANIKT